MGNGTCNNVNWFVLHIDGEGTRATHTHTIERSRFVDLHHHHHHHGHCGVSRCMWLTPSFPCSDSVSCELMTTIDIDIRTITCIAPSLSSTIPQLLPTKNIQLFQVFFPLRVFSFPPEYSTVYTKRQLVYCFRVRLILFRNPNPFSGVQMET